MKTLEQEIAEAVHDSIKKCPDHEVGIGILATRIQCIIRSRKTLELVEITEEEAKNGQCCFAMFDDLLQNIYWWNGNWRLWGDAEAAAMHGANKFYRRLPAKEEK